MMLEDALIQSLKKFLNEEFVTTKFSINLWACSDICQVRSTYYVVEEINNIFLWHFLIDWRTLKIKNTNELVVVLYVDMSDEFSSCWEHKNSVLTAMLRFGFNARSTWFWIAIWKTNVFFFFAFSNHYNFFIFSYFRRATRIE